MAARVQTKKGPFCTFLIINHTFGHLTSNNDNRAPLEIKALFIALGPSPSGNKCLIFQ